MSTVNRTGILGGRFDPIHLGHLGIAEIARRALALDRVLLMPSRTSPHRTAPARATDGDRLAMAALAARADAHLSPCDLELTSDAPSYTSVTLGRLRDRGHQRTQLFFIVGADAFAEIATWHDYPTVLDGAHFVVVSRPGHPVADIVRKLPDLRDRMRPIADDPDGRTVEADTAPAVFLIDAATPDVSSTDIRARVARGAPLAGLVPANVAAYITHHRLYEMRSGKQHA
ncbi:MAG: nicotinate-nucleotide adenylyltransferase [Vicinamibacterales bacterium]|jgi:nicotinate-nucleotide adenylyltransferase|nr:nicotinate-nucleotide adenylyltransferase [Vicinamibacterales bacterium]